MATLGSGAPLALARSLGCQATLPSGPLSLALRFPRGSLTLCPKLGSFIDPLTCPLLLGQQFGPSRCSAPLFRIHTSPPLKGVQDTFFPVLETAHLADGKIKPLYPAIQGPQLTLCFICSTLPQTLAILYELR